MTENLDLNNPFWQFSLAIYAKPGVMETCLELQDKHGADVNLLLWCLWLNHQGIHLSSAQLVQAVSEIEHWREQIIKPIRRLRLETKINIAKITDKSSENSQYNCYQSLKSAELEAEQYQQAQLFQIAAILNQKLEIGSNNVEIYFKNLQINKEISEIYLTFLKDLKP